MSPTTQIPAEVLPALRAYRTAEFATVGRSGVPIAWPTAVLASDEGSSVLLGTAIGFPQKAFNVRRNPRVALLFSDPTGSGAPALRQVLVQGTARCTDEVVTSPVGYERYWSRLWELQPVGRVYDTNPVTRWAMGWYFMRLMITVTPSRVLTRPPVDAADLLSAPTVGRGERDAYAETVRRLPTYRSAVLCSLDEEGTPSLRRVRPTADAVQRVFLLDGDVEPLRAGPASLLCHSHDERLWKLRSMVCLGRLEPRDGGWVFTPTRFVPGAGTDPLTLLRMIRQNRRNAREYLERRQQPRPKIPWHQYAAVRHGRAAAPTARRCSDADPSEDRAG